jgi:hypothetical protein
VALAQVAVSGPQDPYILARVALEKPGDMARLGSLSLDIVRVERGEYVELVSHQDQIDQFRGLGFEVRIVIEDMEAHYARGRKGDNFGDLYTYSEMIDELDAVHATYPSITTARDSIGVTHEGRVLWAIKVSDNPDVQEDEPEVLFDGLHHAREPITVSVCLNTLNYLCRNYDADPYVTYLVDNRQIWFVPIVNPDGYVYNETTMPAGGGMWRKNRRDNGGSYGVDPNRNYPYQWGGVGSSGNPTSDTYRGPYAGSEPEVQSMMNFIEAHQFICHQSYHSVAGMVLIPWAYTNDHTDDDALFRAIGEEMARDNGYDVGQAGEILYNCSGVTCDWSYGDTLSKNKIYAFTTEVGGSGFWPFDHEISALCQENLHADLYLAQIAGVYFVCAGHTIQDEKLKGNGQVDPGESVLMTVTLKNDTPLFDALGVTAILRTDDPYVQLSDAQADFGDIPGSVTADNGSDPFAFSVEGGCPQGHQIPFIMDITANGGAVRSSQEISVMVGQPTVIYSNDFESSSDWTQDPTHTASTGDFVRIDPNPTAYQPGDDATPDLGVYAWITAQNVNTGIDDVDGGISATRSPAIDLSAFPGARLSMMYFHGQRDEGDDPDGDFFGIDLSNDGGDTYPVNLVSFGDVTTSAIWRSLEVDLDQVIALTDQMVIRVQVSEGPPKGDIVEGGIDDVIITSGTGNTPPPPPVLSQPEQGDTVTTSGPLLTVENVTDPEGDLLTYGFRVYGDSLLTGLVASVDGIAPGVGTTSWQVDPPLSSEGMCWWRAFAADSLEWGPASEPASFLYSCVALLWSSVPEAVSYVIYRDSLAGFVPGAQDSVGVTVDTSYMDCDPVAGAAYYVVRAVDAVGRKSEDSRQVGQFERDLSSQEKGRSSSAIRGLR